MIMSMMLYVHKSFCLYLAYLTIYFNINEFVIRLFLSSDYLFHIFQLFLYANKFFHKILLKSSDVLTKIFFPHKMMIQDCFEDGCL